MPLTAAEVYRDFESEGIPSSGPKKPKKAEIRALLKQYETIMSAFTSNGGIIFTSKALLDADIASAANSMAWVIGDSAVDNNGIYQKIGGSGSGAWIRVGDLPYSFARANSVGGTANSIAVTTFVPISEQVLVVFVAQWTTTATPAYVGFNGGPGLRIRTNAGFDIDPGAIRAGMTVAGFKNGADFTLLTDNVASALLSALEGIRDEAEAQADRATTEANASAASATEAAMYAEMLNSAVYDFNFDSDPSDPGYDWNS